MFCRNCGKEIKDDILYCPYCGSEIQRRRQTMQNEVPTHEQSIQVADVPSVDVSMLQDEQIEEDTDQDVDKFKLVGLRRLGNKLITGHTMPTQITINGQEIEVVTRIRMNKVVKNKFVAGQLANIEFKTLPDLLLSDIFRFIIFTVCIPLSYGASILALALSVKLMLSRHMVFTLFDGRKITVPVMQDADAVPFLRRIGYSEHRIAALEAKKLDRMTWLLRDKIIFIVLLVIAGAAMAVGTEKRIENLNAAENHAGVEYTDAGVETLKFKLTVVNNTGVDIYKLYASQVGIDSWEEDVLGDYILYDGQSVNITFTINADTLNWDFAMEDAYGTLIEFYGLSFAECSVEGATLNLQYDGAQGYATLI